MMERATVRVEAVDIVVPGRTAAIGLSTSGAGASPERRRGPVGTAPDRPAFAGLPADTDAAYSATPNGATATTMLSEDNVGTLAAAPLDTHRLASVLQTPGKTFDLGQKIIWSGTDDLVAAPFETSPEHREHCTPLGGKGRIMGNGVFSEQNPHP